MTTQHSNPLTKFFRKPVLYTTLPSRGKWYTTPIKFDNDNEVAVYPTTAGDELLLNNPDALLNGVAIANMIQSCVPAITNAWDAPTFDIDKLLVAARIASHGQYMELTTACPKEDCKEANTFDVDLSILLDSFQSTNILDEPITVNGLVLYLKPLSYKLATKVNLLHFNNEKSLIALRDKDDNNQELHNELISMAKNIMTITTSSCIDKIVLPDNTEVVEYNYIKEFIVNTDKPTYDTIKKEIDKKFEIIQKVTDFDVCCEKCKHQFTVPFSFDTSNFFVVGS